MPVADAATVLLIDDDLISRQTFAADLADRGYSVTAMTAKEARTSLTGEVHWDALIVDTAAIEVLRSTLSGSWQPIRIVLAAHLDPDATIRAMRDYGADACFEKTTHAGVLAATLASLRRRVGLRPPPEPQYARRAGEEGQIWRLSPTRWLLSCPLGATARLTRAETDFLLVLAREPGNPVARERLIAAMGHSSEYYESRRLDTFVSRMRNKVNKACPTSFPLRSIHAVGYAFVAPIQLLD